jgi:hypothetical protein
MCLCRGEGSCRVVRHLQETYLTVRCQLGWNLDGLRRNSSPSSRANYFDVCKRLWRECGQKTLFGAQMLAVPVLEVRSQASSWGGACRSCHLSAIQPCLSCLKQPPQGDSSSTQTGVTLICLCYGLCFLYVVARSPSIPHLFLHDFTSSTFEHCYTICFLVYSTFGEENSARWASNTRNAAALPSRHHLSRQVNLCPPAQGTQNTL